MPTLTDLFDEAELAAAIGGGYVKRTKHPSVDLWILNYTPKCQYEGTWTDLTRACRGLIVDADDKIVARPFGKFFNHGEVNLGYFPHDEPVEVTEKMDGSLGILYWLDGEPFIATRGSFASEQAIEGTKMFREWWNAVESPTIVRQMTGFNNMQNKTFLFEIIYPENRIVVDYGKQRRLTLLAVIDTETGEDLRMPSWYRDVVKRHPYDSLEAVLAAPQLPGHVSEGFVVKFADGSRVKIKHDDYVRLHRIMTRLNPRNIWEIMAVRALRDTLTQPREWATYLGIDPARAQEILELGNDWLADVPDEFYQWVREVETRVGDHYRTLLLDALLNFQGRPSGDRKAMAQYLSGLPSRDILFRMYDQKPFEHLIWKAVRPDATAPFAAVADESS